MSALYRLLVTAHVAANLVWIGAILSVGMILASKSGEVRAGAPFAYELYRKLAVPAFVVSFVAAVARVSMSAQLYFVETTYMHPKLLFALIVIVLHHIIGARAKAVATGRRSSPGPVGMLSMLLLVSAVAATIFVVVKPF